MKESCPLPLDLHVFLTDDGCTDGTTEAVQEASASGEGWWGLHIIQGDGNLYWAGGMRIAWREAMKEGPWDYYLLLNDDTVLSPDTFDTLFSSEDYCLKQFGREGIVSGLVCDPTDPTRMTYGGEVFVNHLTGRRHLLGSSDEPQLCDWTHANILLVPHQVVEEHGILYEGYRHGQADLDYGYRARRRGIPVVVTPRVCGTCPYDHPDIQSIEEQFSAMTLDERRKYLNHPLHSDADYLTMIRRCMPLKYPITWLFRKMNLYMPHLYYWLNKRR
jgi:GT2 family glycosyltransferase